MKSASSYISTGRLLIACTLLLGSATAAQAATVFDQGSNNVSYGIRGDLWNADDFTLSASSLLSGATFYFGYYTSDNTNIGLNYTLYADNGGQPGAILQNGSATPQVTNLVTRDDRYSTNAWAFDFASPVQALANVRYWIGIQQGSDRVAVGQLADGGDPGSAARVSFYGNTEGYFPAGRGLAFSLQGTAIEAPSAVPEPATWALMIGGFAMVGAAMRRRQRTIVRFA